MNNEDIDRINTLYHKMKAVGLTPEEQEEQKRLRKAYTGLSAAPRQRICCRGATVFN